MHNGDSRLIRLIKKKSVQHNGTIYAHIFAAQHQVPIDPRHPAHVPDAIVYQQHGNFKIEGVTCETDF